LENLEVLVGCIQDQKELIFKYHGYENLIFAQPYKIVITNHTYYLLATNNEKLKVYDVSKISEIKRLGSFKPIKKYEEEVKERTSRYGIKDDQPVTLRVKCKNIETLDVFDRYFEGKGIKNTQELTYIVVGNSENELYYPLFSIGTKKNEFEFLDEDFKNNYIKYLKKQIWSIENGQI
jgi:hypothetical protein